MFCQSLQKYIKNQIQFWFKSATMCKMPTRDWLAGKTKKGAMSIAGFKIAAPLLTIL
jgi:hypothetical protein